MIKASAPRIYTASVTDRDHADEGVVLFQLVDDPVRTALGSSSSLPSRLQDRIRSENGLSALVLPSGSRRQLRCGRRAGVVNAAPAGLLAIWLRASSPGPNRKWMLCGQEKPQTQGLGLEERGCDGACAGRSAGTARADADSDRRPFICCCGAGAGGDRRRFAQVFAQLIASPWQSCASHSWRMVIERQTTGRRELCVFRAGLRAGRWLDRKKSPTRSPDFVEWALKYHSRTKAPIRAIRADEWAGITG